MLSNSETMKKFEATQERIADTLDTAEKALTGVVARLAPAAVQVARPGGANAGSDR